MNFFGRNPSASPILGLHFLSESKVCVNMAQLEHRNFCFQLSTSVGCRLANVACPHSLLWPELASRPPSPPREHQICPNAARRPGGFWEENQVTLVIAPDCFTSASILKIKWAWNCVNIPYSIHLQCSHRATKSSTCWSKKVWLSQRIHTSKKVFLKVKLQWNPKRHLCRCNHCRRMLILEKLNHCSTFLSGFTPFFKLTKDQHCSNEQKRMRASREITKWQISKIVSCDISFLPSFKIASCE